ncbi:antitoxin [Nostocoides sp. F2B08]|uniref:antitoxin n=1 Tax=Nostocoides sp. F2B08 TaxID=2653936 RepID=UPI00126347A4|nr:antitoxin [Tetrasphaera sp. F2B08]KAB7744844.1 antitoxin [Tetrasphaera sp. F2B08]
MRTTLTLDDDVARLVAEATRREKRSTEAVVNDAPRHALAPGEPRPYRAPVFDAEVLAGVDAGRLNQLADELDDDVATEKLGA